MIPNVDSMIAIMLDNRNGRERFEALRIKEIRESDILKEGWAFNGTLESARYLGATKPMTGLVELRKILTKMNR